MYGRAMDDAKHQGQGAVMQPMAQLGRGSEIDLRSDTVTRPTAGMLMAMAAAKTGDDVFGDDPSINQLQERLAADLGFESGLFMPTGTMSNLCALMAHCERGDEYLVGQLAHTYKYEAGGAAVLGSIQPQPLEQAPDGSIAIEKISAAIKPDDPHFARTRLLALENTFGGQVMPQAYIASATAFAHERGLATHLDGARLYNAAVAQGIAARQITRHFDSVSVCLSKGLGAPAGSVLLGSKHLLAKAHRIRKMLGGGMRQAGVLAAAGLYALDHHVVGLADDHRRAAAIGEALSAVPGLDIRVATNMVWVNPGVDPTPLDRLADYLLAHGVDLLNRRPLRLVTHLDFSDKALGVFCSLIEAFGRRMDVATT
jgi:threonine aldolase